MSRKIVYIVVFITTIALVVYNDYQQNSTLNDALDSNETRELNIAESYNSSELPTSLTIQNYQNGGLNLFDSNPFLKKNKEQTV